MMKKIKILLVVILASILCVQPINAEEVKLDETLALTSNNIVVYNLNDHSVMYEKKAEEKMFPASMTKIMSALVAIEAIDDYEKKVSIEPQALEGLLEANASVAGFMVNDQVTYRDLLYGTLLPSGADATNQLAISLFGSSEKMVDAMNEKAKELGFANTHFSNVTGLHDDDHYTTMLELTHIFEVALKNDMFKEIIQADQYIYANGDRKIEMNSTILNLKAKMNKPSYFIEGGKTGFTPEAGMCLLSYATYNDETYIVGVADASKNYDSYDSLADSEKLYDYFFNQYERKVMIKKGDVIKTFKVRFGKTEQFTYKADKDIKGLINRTANVKDFKSDYDGPTTIEAPVNKGEYLGEFKMYGEKRLIFEIDVYANENIERDDFAYFKNEVTQFMKENGVMLVMTLSVTFYLLYMGFFLYKRNKNK